MRKPTLNTTTALIDFEQACKFEHYLNIQYVRIWSKIENVYGAA